MHVNLKLYTNVLPKKIDNLIGTRILFNKNSLPDDYEKIQ
jgi:hypothetical protein